MKVDKLKSYKVLFEQLRLFFNCLTEKTFNTILKLFWDIIYILERPIHNCIYDLIIWCEAEWRKLHLDS